MKSPFILFALFFLFTIITHLTSVTAAPDIRDSTHSSIIRDMNGKPLVPGYYYIVPALRGFRGGGGIEIAQTGNDSSCTASIVQSPSQASNGLEISITPYGRVYGILANHALRITYGPLNLPSCTSDDSPNYWIAVKDEQTERWSFKVADEANGVFVIEKFEQDAVFYKIKFYLKQEFVDDDEVSGYVRIDIGSDGLRRLVLAKDDEEAFLVQFKYT